MGEGGALGGWSLVQANGVRNSQGAEVHQRQVSVFESWHYFRSREYMTAIDLSPFLALATSSHSLQVPELLALPLLAPRPEADI